MGWRPVKIDAEELEPQFLRKAGDQRRPPTMGKADAVEWPYFGLCAALVPTDAASTHLLKLLN